MNHPPIKQMKDITGTTYNVLLTDEAKMKMELESYMARYLWEILKDQQPQRFQQMMNDQTLIPTLNQAANIYNEELNRLWWEQGIPIAEAKAQAWSNLVAMIGL
ncbi:MAG: hypothetical protein LBE91_12455 [Tannerella sp.]|nr:hypothetical protein [Tannerella sp.]